MKMHTIIYLECAWIYFDQTLRHQKILEHQLSSLYWRREWIRLDKTEPK